MTGFLPFMVLSTINFVVFVLQILLCGAEKEIVSSPLSGGPLSVEVTARLIGFVGEDISGTVYTSCWEN